MYNLKDDRQAENSGYRGAGGIAGRWANRVRDMVGGALARIYARSDAAIVPRPMPVLRTEREAGTVQLRVRGYLRRAAPRTYPLAGSRKAVCTALVLALLAIGLPTGTGARADKAPLTVHNITIQHYPQGRGVNCSDPYPNITSDWHFWEYIQSDFPNNTRFDGGPLDTDCESHIIVTFGGAPPTITYRSQVNYRLAVTVTFTSSNNLTVYLPQENAGDCYNGFGDNVVTIDDYNLLYGSFGRSYGDSQYVDACDFDGDGTVTIADYTMLYNHFGQAGTTTLR